MGSDRVAGELIGEICTSDPVSAAIFVSVGAFLDRVLRGPNQRGHAEVRSGMNPEDRLEDADPETGSQPGSDGEEHEQQALEVPGMIFGNVPDEQDCLTANPTSNVKIANASPPCLCI
jgi:hypothetical protein